MLQKEMTVELLSSSILLKYSNIIFTDTLKMHYIWSNNTVKKYDINSSTFNLLK